MIFGIRDVYVLEYAADTMYYSAFCFLCDTQDETACNLTPIVRLVELILALKSLDHKFIECAYWRIATLKNIYASVAQLDRAMPF